MFAVGWCAKSNESNDNDSSTVGDISNIYGVGHRRESVHSPREFKNEKYSSDVFEKIIEDDPHIKLKKGVYHFF